MNGTPSCPAARARARVGLSSQFSSAPTNSSAAKPVASQNPYTIRPNASLTAPIASGASTADTHVKKRMTPAAGTVLGLRQAADALRVDRRIDHRHEQPGQRQQIDRPAHAAGDADDEAQQDAAAEQREHGLPLERASASRRRESGRPRAGERRSRCCRPPVQWPPLRVACEQRRHPHVDRGLDADVEKRAGRERQHVRVLHRAAGSAEATAAAPAWSSPDISPAAPARSARRR